MVSFICQRDDELKMLIYYLRINYMSRISDDNFMAYCIRAFVGSHHSFIYLQNIIICDITKPVNIFYTAIYLTCETTYM